MSPTIVRLGASDSGGRRAVGSCPVRRSGEEGGEQDPGRLRASEVPRRPARLPQDPGQRIARTRTGQTQEKFKSVNIETRKEYERCAY